MDSIPTYVGQEIRKCMAAIREAQKALKDPDTPRLQQYNLKRRIESQRRKMQKLEKRKTP